MALKEIPDASVQEVIRLARCGDQARLSKCGEHLLNNLKTKIYVLNRGAVEPLNDFDITAFKLQIVLRKLPESKERAKMTGELIECMAKRKGLNGYNSYRPAAGIGESMLAKSLRKAARERDRIKNVAIRNAAVKQIDDIAIIDGMIAGPEALPLAVKFKLKSSREAVKLLGKIDALGYKLTIGPLSKDAFVVGNDSDFSWEPDKVPSILIDKARSKYIGFVKGSPEIGEFPLIVRLAILKLNRIIHAI